MADKDHLDEQQEFIKNDPNLTDEQRAALLKMLEERRARKQENKE